MIGLSPLDPSHENTLKGRNSSDLHENINPHFILLRSRSPGFGSCHSDSPRFHTVPLVNCGLIAFASIPVCSWP